MVMRRTADGQQSHCSGARKGQVLFRLYAHTNVVAARLCPIIYARAHVLVGKDTHYYLITI